MELVREYAASNSDAAFAELVRRRINLVYSVAFRRLGDPHSAEEVTQAVFIILAKKAADACDAAHRHFRLALIKRHNSPRRIFSALSSGVTATNRRPSCNLSRIPNPMSRGSACNHCSRTPWRDSATSERDAVVLPRFLRSRTVGEVAAELNRERKPPRRSSVNRRHGEAAKVFTRVAA